MVLDVPPGWAFGMMLERGAFTLTIMNGNDDVLANCTLFCNNHLSNKVEPFCNRWIHISSVDATVNKDWDTNTFGHCYFDIIGNEERIEFHVDYWNHVRGAAALRMGKRLESVKATTSVQLSS